MSTCFRGFRFRDINGAPSTESKLARLSLDAEASVTANNAHSLCLNLKHRVIAPDDGCVMCTSAHQYFLLPRLICSKLFALHLYFETCCYIFFFILRTSKTLSSDSVRDESWRECILLAERISTQTGTERTEQPNAFL